MNSLKTYISRTTSSNTDLRVTEIKKNYNWEHYSCLNDQIDNTHTQGPSISILSYSHDSKIFYDVILEERGGSINPNVFSNYVSSGVVNSHGINSNTCFRLLRTPNLEEAQYQHDFFKEDILTIAKASDKIFKDKILQKLCDRIRETKSGNRKSTSGKDLPLTRLVLDCEFYDALKERHLGEVETQSLLSSSNINETFNNDGKNFMHSLIEQATQSKKKKELFEEFMDNYVYRSDYNSNEIIFTGNSINSKNIYHYAVLTEKYDIVRKICDGLQTVKGSNKAINAICRTQINALDSTNNKECTPLALAIIKLHEIENEKLTANKKKSEIETQKKIIRCLIENGAEMHSDQLTDPPIFLAVQYNLIEIVDDHGGGSNRMKTSKNKKLNESLLHVTNTKEMAKILIEDPYNLDVNTPDYNGNTCLHAAILNNKVELALYLILNDIDRNAVNNENYSPLALAIQTDHLKIVRQLLLFGANPRVSKLTDQSVAKVAEANSHKKYNAQIQKALRQCGAMEISNSVSRGASVSDNRSLASVGEGWHTHGLDMPVNVIYDQEVSSSKPRPGQLNLNKNNSSDQTKLPTLDSIITDTSIDSANTIPVSDVFSRSSLSTSPRRSTKERGLRILSLDGGGIRGIILSKILGALEQEAKIPCNKLFDVIAGTSTGAIMASLLCLGKSPEYIQSIYFKMKDEVFVGSKPYNVDKMESFMKKEVGEFTKMKDIKNHKLLITATLADRKPIDNFFFRSYDRLGGTDPRDEIRDFNKNEKFKKLPDENAPLWYAMRCSSAAPLFFPPKDGFIDGGVVANNPSLDVLEEIHRYNKELKKLGQEPLKIDTFCSVGTGRKPLEQIDPDSLNVPAPKWTSISTTRQTYEKGKVVAGLLFASLTHTEDYITRRVEAWCEMVDIKYFRLNTQLPKRILLDEIDDHTLYDILWDAQVWVYENREILRKLARRLKKGCDEAVDSDSHNSSVTSMSGIKVVDD